MTDPDRVVQVPDLLPARGNSYLPPSRLLLLLGGPARMLTMKKDCGMLKQRFPYLPIKVIAQAYKDAKGKLRDAASALAKVDKSKYPPVAAGGNGDTPAITSFYAPLPLGELIPMNQPLGFARAKVPAETQTSAVSKSPPKAALSKAAAAKPKQSISDKYNRFSLTERLAALRKENGHAAKKRRLVRQGGAASDEDLEILAASDAKRVKKSTVVLDDEVAANATDDEDLDDVQYVEQLPGPAKVFETLQFLNTALVTDIAGVANVPLEVAQQVVAQRPYLLVEAVEEALLDDPLAPRKKGSRAKPWGVKLVERALTMLAGYEAVESLVLQCQSYGRTIRKEIGRWGVNKQVTADGELEVVEVDVATPLATPLAVATPVMSDDDSDDNDYGVVKKRSSFAVPSERVGHVRYISHPPSLLAPGVELKNYQQVGLLWINLLYRHQLLCILADEMGLGKTCQVISFMAYLKETLPATCGRHLVVVPLLTLENWMREFSKFCPLLVVKAYYGLMPEREDLRLALDEDPNYDVLVTTYNLATGAKQDHGFLRSRGFNVVVYDEGHMLKNSALDRYTKLMKLQARFRLLLTGTPLQNNLRELVLLLAFILPQVFVSKQQDLQLLFDQKATTSSSFNPLLLQQAVLKARTMMTPFVLRRRKDQVLNHLPAKTRTKVMCRLTPVQREIYDQHVAKAQHTKLERERRKALLLAEQALLLKLEPLPTSTNVIMQLRKALLHPLLFRHLYTDKTVREMASAIMEEPAYTTANRDYIIEDMEVMLDFELHQLCVKFPNTLERFQLSDDSFTALSGKVLKLMELLPPIMDAGNRVLVFSLFTQILDILEVVLLLMGVRFVRLDGSTPVDERQDTIDQFYDDDSIKVFLLLTKAGGFGINLVCANHVVIFDQLFNPHDDRQAEDRAHRVGQTQEVKVVRLVSEDTVEESIYQLAENKLALDQSISEDASEEASASMFELLLFGKGGDEGDEGGEGGEGAVAGDGAA